MHKLEGRFWNQRMTNEESDWRRNCLVKIWPSNTILSEFTVSIIIIQKEVTNHNLWYFFNGLTENIIWLIIIFSFTMNRSLFYGRITHPGVVNHLSIIYSISYKLAGPYRTERSLTISFRRSVFFIFHRVKSRVRTLAERSEGK